MQTGFSPDPHRAGPVEHIGEVSGCDQNTSDETTADPDRTGPVEHVGAVSGCDQNTGDETQQTLVLAVFSLLCFPPCGF